MDERAFAWTALPPLSLRGLDSELVESIDYYLLRMSRTTGWSVPQLMNLVAEQRGQGISGRSLRFHCMDPSGASMMLKLERLTGVRHLRHGTFWAIRNVICPKTPVGWNLSSRRWCPCCYKSWDNERDWEPLIWSIPYISRCPVHQCALVSECPACGASQLRSTRLDIRQTCRSCKSSLADKGRPVAQPSLFDWVDRQILSLVKLCAKAEQETLPREVASQLAMDLRSKLKERRGISRFSWRQREPGSEQSTSFFTLKELLNICAIQGVSVIDLLTRPREAMDIPLLDLWSGFSWISDPFAKEDDPVREARWMARRILGHKRLLYLPPIRVLAKDVRVSLSRLREFDPEIYGTYMHAYENQGGPTALYIRGKAFAVARQFLEGFEFSRKGYHYFSMLPHDVEKAAHVTRDEAVVVCRTAVVYSQLLARALKHSVRSFAAKNDMRWLETARWSQK